MNRISVVFIFLAALAFCQSGMAANSCNQLVHNSRAQAYSSEVTVIIGTDRAHSNSKLISREILKHLVSNSGLKVNLIDLSQLPASLIKSDYFEKKPARFLKDFVDPIERSSGLIIIAPEYDGGVPGILSYYLNHVRLRLDKKQVALIGISAGKWGARAALDAFKVTLNHRGARILSDVQVNIENINEKIQNDRLHDSDSEKRLAKMADELTTAISASADTIPAQKALGQLAEALSGKQVEMKLSNSNAIMGKLSQVTLNENNTLAYVQFTGPTVLKNKGQIIPGQETLTHPSGYGMPVGKIEGFKKEWFRKDSFAGLGINVGKKLKLNYESGIVVNGTLKNMTFDSEGNLLVLTFSDVSVKKGTKTLFQKSWGDFDLAVGDHIEQIVPF